MLATSVPEIQRTNLSNVVLLLKAMGVNDMLAFDFMDSPPVQTLINAMEGLWTLMALDDEGLLTKVGRKMAEFPMEPQLSKMLLTSVDLKCSDEIMTIVAMLSVQNVFLQTKGQASNVRPKEGEISPTRGRSLYPSGGVQRMGTQPLLKSLVLRELHPGQSSEAFSGCEEADDYTHGPL
jgi:ATP-dependent RNA helicase DHX8/PRP22